MFLIYFTLFSILCVLTQFSKTCAVSCASSLTLERRPCRDQIILFSCWFSCIISRMHYLFVLSGIHSHVFYLSCWERTYSVHKNKKCAPLSCSFFNFSSMEDFVMALRHENDSKGCPQTPYELWRTQNDTLRHKRPEFALIMKHEKTLVRVGRSPYARCRSSEFNDLFLPDCVRRIQFLLKSERRYIY